MEENFDWTQREAPTHVENRDVVWMGMTFIQIIMFILTSAISYVIYQQPFIQALPSYWTYVPPIVAWVIGAICIMVQVGGRSIVFVVMDIGKFFMAKREYGERMGDFLEAPPAVAEAEAGAEGFEPPHKRVLAFVTSRFGG